MRLADRRAVLTWRIVDTTGWLIVVMGLIALAFAVVVWRLFGPGRRERLEHDARLPLDDVGESDES